MTRLSFRAIRSGDSLEQAAGIAPDAIPVADGSISRVG
jgi:hypothetical protein